MRTIDPLIIVPFCGTLKYRKEVRKVTEYRYANEKAKYRYHRYY